MTDRLEQTLARPADGVRHDRRFWFAIGGITIAQVLLRGWGAAGGWFYWDDFWWHDIVARNSIGDAAGLSLGGHYSPLTYIPYWLVTWAFPYEWAPRVVVMLVTLLGINAGVLAVTRRLWPTRGPQLAVYLLWAFSTLAAPSWLWYSQFSMMGALLLTSTWTLWAYLRALQRPGATATVIAVAALSGSLFTQERMASLALLLGAFLLWVVKPGLPGAWSGRRGLWWGSAAAMAVWTLVYLRLPGEAAAPASPGDGLVHGLAMVRVSGMPALLGGPWVLDDEPVLRRAATPLWLQVMVLAALLGLVLLSQRGNRRAWRAWVILGAGLLVDAALVMVGRGNLLEMAHGEWRYFSDLAVLAPLLMVAAFVPPGAGPAGVLRSRRLVSAGLALFTASAMVTTIPLGQQWHRSASRPVITTAAKNLAAAGPVAVLDRWFPPQIVNPALGEQRVASKVLSILDLPVMFDGTTMSPLWIDDSGALVPGGLVDRRGTADAGACAFPVRGVQTTTISLPAGPDYYDWGVRLDYTAARDTRIVVSESSRRRDVDLPAGTHSIYVALPGLGSQIMVYLADPSAQICISQVTAGKAGPAGSG